LAVREGALLRCRGSQLRNRLGQLEEKALRTAPPPFVYIPSKLVHGGAYYCGSAEGTPDRGCRWGWISSIFLCVSFLV